MAIDTSVMRPSVTCHGNGTFARGEVFLPLLDPMFYIEFFTVKPIFLNLSINKSKSP